MHWGNGAGVSSSPARKPCPQHGPGRGGTHGNSHPTTFMGSVPIFKSSNSSACCSQHQEQGQQLSARPAGERGPRAEMARSSSPGHQLLSHSGLPRGMDLFLAQLKGKVTTNAVVATSEEEIGAVSAPLSVLHTLEPERTSLTGESEQPSPGRNGEGDTVLRQGMGCDTQPGFPAHSTASRN